MYSLEVYVKSFVGQKGGSLEPLEPPPPAYGPVHAVKFCLLAFEKHSFGLNMVSEATS